MNENYLDILLNDHAIIEKALVLLEQEAERGSKMKITMSKTIIDFLWDYGEKCHNQKEEQIYFPLLLRRGLPPQGPVAVMLQEHEYERNFIFQLREMLSIAESTGQIPDNYKETLEEYTEVTKNHIWKENDILYPMGKRVVSPDDETYLAEEFQRIEASSVGTGGYIRYKSLIDTLENQSGEKINLLLSLPYDVISNMLDVLPVELSFVDADDRVRYFTKLNEKKIFTRSLSVIGRTVQQCHPEKSVHLVNQIIAEMKEGKRQKATFWINFGEMFVHISYFAVRGENGEYQGCVEMVHDIKPYRELDGEKRLLDLD